ncbi:MAG: sulfotransferase family protein [Planctomycetota bacterium]|nr:MAG: sulfotransferase family protein [Planctomycetota bacterium]REJ94605.1 MAG: sulfotransferase family protein [Planctomycetota bacterium]
MSSADDPAAAAQELLSTGRLDEAIELLREAIDRSSGNASWHRALGKAYMAGGRLADALRSLEHSLKLDTRDPATLTIMGEALLEAGRADQAAIHFRSAVEVSPQATVARRRLADLLVFQGQLEEARRHYETVLQQTSDDADARNGLGVVCMLSEDYSSAIDYFKSALRIDPQLASARNNLTALQGLSGSIDEKIAPDQGLAHNGEAAQVTVNAALALIQQGDAEQAVSAAREAAHLDPTNSQAPRVEGVALTNLGRFDEAIGCFERALAINPHEAYAYINLGALAAERRYEFSAEQLTQIERLVAQDDLPNDQRASLHFLLAARHDARGDSRSAFAAYERGNQLRLAWLASTGKSFDREKRRRSTDRSIAVFDQALFERLLARDPAGPAPVFVVGMPRSGTSLVEQILTSDPHIFGAGELLEVASIASGLVDRTEGYVTYPDCLRKATIPALQSAARRYAEMLVTRGRGTTQRWVDKTPGNFFYLGLIALLFPNAKLVHCRRDPLDVCLSCYICDFATLNFTSRLEDIGVYHRQYERLMRHWREVLPLAIHDVDYERLVREPEATTRALMEFCDLPWTEACLASQVGRRTVSTASRIQVRQPIYTTSVDRWRRYEAFLEPLKRALQDANDQGDAKTPPLAAPE